MHTFLDRRLTSWVLVGLVGATIAPEIGAACSCTGISLRSGSGGPNDSSVYCTEDLADIEADCDNLGQGAEGCADELYAYRCPLGAVSLGDEGDQRVGWNFEIAATLNLTDGSAAADCEHAQFATRTGTVDGVVAPNPAAEDTPEAGEYEFDDGPEVVLVASPTPYPQFGAISEDDPQFGADGYDEGVSQQNLNIGGDAPQITWIDTPDFNWDAAETGTVSFEFFSWVDASDEDGQNCWCRFTILRTWDGNVAGGAGLALVDGLNCAVAN